MSNEVGAVTITSRHFLFYIFMFHDEFYPTPLDVIYQMQIDCANKVVLEPHAGKGNIVDFLNDNGAKKVLTFEINKDLQNIVKTKSLLLGSDFFDCTAEMISHVQLIVMNPPFSNANKHILHAWNIAPEGCEIISLCNYSLIEEFRYSNELKMIVQNNGITEYLGDCFKQAERTTGVDIGLIKIYKPIVSDSFDFNGYFTQEADNEEEEVNGIMKHNEVRACVNVYVGVMKQFDELKANLDYMNNSLAYIGIGKVSLQLGYKDSITNKEDFSIEIKKRAWTHLFNKMNLEKFVTTGVQKDLNKFVETQQQIPFTMRNIYKMFEVIVGTRKDTFNRALEEVIDNFTRYTHENRFEVEGWKTNLGYMLNKKFIINYACDTDYKNHVNIKNNSRQNQMEDLTKVICSIEGEDFNNISHFNTWNLKKLNGLLNENDNRQIRGYEQKLQYSTWYSYGFFDVKFFKKGTAHFKFKDLDVWYRLNQTYSSIKGFVLSDKYKK